MKEQATNENFLSIGDKCGETRESSPSKTTTDSDINNLDTSLAGSEHISLSYSNCDRVKFLDIQCAINDQSNEVLTLKLSEYEKALAERDHTIKSLHTNMMNSENTNKILTNQYNSIIEKSKSVNDTYTCLNTRFSNICERLSKLGDTICIARTSRKDIVNLINQTTNKFQEQILNISSTIDDSLKKVSLEKIKAEQEMEIFKNKYSLDLLAYKNNAEACAKEMEVLNHENNILREKFNEANMKLNEEKETIFNLNQHYEKLLKEMESQNIVLLNQNKSVNIKYDEIVIENQTLKDEFTIVKTSLDENKNQIDMHLNIIKEQTELLDDLKIYKDLNDTLKKENFSLKERNEHLEKISTELMDEIRNIKLTHNEIQEVKENKFKNMCQNYDYLLKMQEDKLQNLSEKLKLQKENEIDMHNKVIGLKQEVEMSNKQIINLQDEVKSNCILIPELHNKIDGLNTELAITSQKLQGSVQALTTEKNYFEKKKTELENQSKDFFKQIEKLTNNYMKYKTKAKQLYIEVARLRYQCSRTEQKKPKYPPASETIELSDKEVNVHEDISVVEFNNQDMSNMSILSNIQSTSNKINQINNSRYKRNLSSLNHDNNSGVKKRRASVDIVPKQRTPNSTNMVKNNNDYQRINRTLSSSFRSIELKHEDKNYTKNKEFTNNNQIVKGYYEQSNENHDQTKFIKNGSNPDAKKMFKIPDDIKLPQKNPKAMNIQTVNWFKPNSPVLLTVASPRRSTPQTRAPLLRPRLQPYAVPHLFSARKRLKFEETTEHETEVLLIKDISISSNFGICDVLESPIQKISFIESKQELDKIVAILLDHNYSTINNVNFHPDPNANIAIDTSEFNISLDNREDAYDLINSWELKLPQNWHKYLSNDKKLIGISEIIFLKNGKHTNSFLRKNIIIDMNLKVTCNILGKNICNDKLQNSINKILIQEHLENIIREVATVKICRGLDLHSKK